MASSLTTTDELAIPGRPDGISIVRWFGLYATMLTAAGLSLAILLSDAGGASYGSWGAFKASLPEMPRVIKLLAFGIYISLCCTFIPLPANWIVAAVATRTVAVGTGLWDTVLLVGSVGALASTIANLNDYHLFTWMLRHHKIARVRHTRIYGIAVRWFEKSPFFLLVVFNILPIPVDVVRMLAATHRYPRRLFAAANFVGRMVRYGAIAYLVYRCDLSVEIAAGIMLGLAAVLLAAKAAPRLWSRPNAGQASPGR